MPPKHYASHWVRKILGLDLAAMILHLSFVLLLLPLLLSLATLSEATLGSLLQQLQQHRVVIIDPQHTHRDQQDAWRQPADQGQSLNAWKLGEHH